MSAVNRVVMSSSPTPCFLSCATPWSAMWSVSRLTSSRSTTSRLAVNDWAKSYLRSEASMPYAESTGAADGRWILLMPVLRATLPTCNPAAPPKASREKFRGSPPRRTVSSRIPSAMAVVTTSSTPRAASSKDSPRGPQRASSQLLRPGPGASGSVHRGNSPGRGIPGPGSHR